MKKPTMYRKRFEPMEVVDITGDDLIYRDEQLIVTSWEPIKPRDDIGKGISFTFLDKGYKVSEIYDSNYNFKHWYCDIIDVEYDAKVDEYIFVDLLLDVIIYHDKSFKILDIEEVVELLSEKRITEEEVKKGLINLNNLLLLIYEDDFLPKNYQELKKNIVIKEAQK